VSIDTAKLADRLADAAQRHRVPGASLGVLHDGEIAEATYGVLNKQTGVEVTADSLFQIGSITKVYTATIVMRLVEAGQLSLDEPVVSYLPEFAVADREVTEAVTCRHLLAHTSGIDGDHFLDTGRGDDCLERYVASMAGLRQNHPLGATMSYCNSGYSLLGRVIEKVTGKLWDRALNELLLAPLGLTRTVTLPEEAIRFRAALGHLAEGAEDPHAAPVWGLMRSCGPAGLISATAADVLTFARLYLDGGVAADGTRLLEAETIRQMREPQVAVPDRWTLGSHWGLGWILFDWGAGVYGHDGNTIGQSAYLRIVPEAGLAITMLTNGGSPADVYRELFAELLAELAGVCLPARPEPAALPGALDSGRFVGVYERASARIEVTGDDGRLRLTMTNTGPLSESLEAKSHTLDLVPAQPEENLFVVRPEGTDQWLPVVFFELAGGRRYVHFGARATPKVA
jgi:CubicO group peptidase (beta-lactamase class C family)